MSIQKKIITAFFEADHARLNQVFRLHRMIFTLGHSTRSLDELLRILRAYGIQMLVDVRTIPRSRHNPQFNKYPFAAGN